MRWNSVRVRLTLWNVAVLAFVLAGFSAILCYSVRVSLAQAVDRDLADRAHRIAEAWARPFRRPPPDRPPPPRGKPLRPSVGTTEAERRGFFRQPRFLTPEGHAMLPHFEYGPWDPDTFYLSLAGLERYSTLVVEGELIRTFSVPLMRGDEVEGVLQVAHPLTEQQRLNDGLVRTLLTLIPLALLVAGLGGAFLTERALRPVREVTQAAAQIGAEDLSRRLKVTGDDEMAELGRTFNGMIARLEEAFRRLEAANEQQRRFVGDASHELRTPLTTIKANTSLALSGPPSLENYRLALLAADQAADTMTRIVQDLLLLARSDAGRLELDRRPTSLREVAERAAASVGGHASEEPRAPIHLDFPSGPDEPLVDGDAHSLVRLVANLLENALRHTPVDGEIVVAGEPEPDGATVRLTVRDTGEGIPPEHLPHVCERFYRVDAARAHAGHALGGGTGLGLAICRSIAEAHGGSLAIESEVGRGTVVTVRLPRAAGAPPEGTVARLREATIARA